MARQLELKALIIDNSPQALEKLDAAMRPDFLFEYLDVVTSARKAIEYFIDMPFQLCLVSENFSSSEMQIFFHDYSKLEQAIPCIFVQFREKIPKDFDRSSMSAFGYKTVISINADRSDKKALWQVLDIATNSSEFRETVNELDGLVEKLTKEIDLTAKQHKRGYKKALNTVVGRYLRDSNEKFEQLKDEYIKRLIDQTDSATPFASMKLDVSDEALKRKLPKLDKDGYKGVSHRVYLKLVDLFGTNPKRGKLRAPRKKAATKELPKESEESE